MRYLVLGAGMMGSAVAYDLIHAAPDVEVVLADVNPDAAAAAVRTIGPRVRAMRLDVRDPQALSAALRGNAVVISAVSYAVNETVTRAAIDAGVHMCDLGGNNDVVDRQTRLDAEARARGVTIIPNCGLAPGLINILASTGMRSFDTVEEIHLRVGGLPQQPRPPLNYQIVFSVEGLINEYLEPAEIIEDGEIRRVESMTGLEPLQFPPPYGRMEAFHTSGGISTLARALKGKVRHLDYKTIRYPGHCDKFKMLLDLGFAASEPVLAGTGVRTMRELFTELLKRKLTYDEPDVVLARATFSGTVRGQHRTLEYECIDSYDAQSAITAMMRTTAFPTSVTALLLADGTITARGVLMPEACVPGDRMIAELAKRNIQITTRSTESIP
jgi:lysine 6-dehydrogenase